VNLGFYGCSASHPRSTAPWQARQDVLVYTADPFRDAGPILAYNNILLYRPIRAHCDEGYVSSDVKRMLQNNVKLSVCYIGLYTTVMTKIS